MAKEYFISGLSKSQLALLNGTGVRLCSSVVSEGREGIRVIERNLGLVLYHLKMEVVDERLADDYSGFYIPTLRAAMPSAAPRVQIILWREDSSKRDPIPFRLAAEEVLLPAMQRRILIYGYRDAENPVSVPSPDFHIHIWSSSKGGCEDGKNNRCATAFGLSMDDPTAKDWNWFAPSGEGVPINNPDNGRPIAELIGDHLYIFPPFSNNRIKMGAEIFRKILEATVEHLIVDPVERKRMLQEQTRATFVNTCNVVASEFERTVSSIKEREAMLVSGKRSLLQASQGLQAAKQDLRRICCSTSKQEVLLGREFDNILQIPEVVRVKVENGQIEVFTDTIYCRDPRSEKWHELGKFRIVVSFTGEFPVYFFNQTRKVTGYQSGMSAPHVFSEGKPCLGDAKETFYELRKKFELSTLVMYAIEFLKSVNVRDGAGQHIDQWPLAKEQPPRVVSAPVVAAVA